MKIIRDNSIGRDVAVVLTAVVFTVAVGAVAVAAVEWVLMLLE